MLHKLLDFDYGEDGDRALRTLLEQGADSNFRDGDFSETPLHVAARRRRVKAVEILLDHGADIDARTAGGKTAYAHSIRRGFADVVAVLRSRGCSTQLNEPDLLAVAIVNGDLTAAEAILASYPGLARTGNPEEDRLLADVAGRNDNRPVELLIRAGADLSATGLDSGTPLHQAAWFGQPQNARLLLAAGAPVDVFDSTHYSSPLGWAVHGSQYSGGAAARQDAYLALVQTFLAAGASLHYPDEPRSDAYLNRLLEDASPKVRQVLEQMNEKLE